MVCGVGFFLQGGGMSTEGGRKKRSKKKLGGVVSKTGPLSGVEHPRFEGNLESQSHWAKKVSLENFV